jgi:hypothetical protein
MNYEKKYLKYKKKYDNLLFKGGARESNLDPQQSGNMTPRQLKSRPPLSLPLFPPQRARHFPAH